MRNTGRNRDSGLALGFQARTIAALSVWVSVLAAPVPVAGAGALKVGQRANPAAKDSCFQCHSVIEGTSVTFKDDVHYHHTISCADCHGGKTAMLPSTKLGDRPDRMSPHRGDYLTLHRIDGRVDPTSCYECHGRANNDKCTACHK